MWHQGISTSGRPKYHRACTISTASYRSTNGVEKGGFHVLSASGGELWDDAKEGPYFLVECGGCLGIGIGHWFEHRQVGARADAGHQRQYLPGHFLRCGSGQHARQIGGQPLLGRVVDALTRWSRRCTSSGGKEPAQPAYAPARIRLPCDYLYGRGPRPAGGEDIVCSVRRSEVRGSEPWPTGPASWGRRRCLARVVSRVRMVTIQASPVRNTKPIAAKGCMPKV